MNTPNNDDRPPRRDMSMSLTDGGVMVEDSTVASQTVYSSICKLSRLLLVDDDPALLDALASTLEFHLGPLLLDACNTAAQALDQVKANGYDAMIVDVNMPNMDGLELLSAVKLLQPHTPVLLISAYADESLIAKGFAAGASDFIPKPFDRDKFMCAVRRGLERSRSVKANQSTSRTARQLRSRDRGPLR
jgi:DNA-binding NtrC family response regulator